MFGSDYRITGTPDFVPLHGILGDFWKPVVKTTFRGKINLKHEHGKYVKAALWQGNTICSFYGWALLYNEMVWSVPRSWLTFTLLSREGVNIHAFHSPKQQLTHILR